jgi:flagellar basal-body rod protein FlgF
MQRKMEVIANNLANSSTAGFKGEQMMFVEYLADVVGKDEISFVQDIAVVRDYREGAFAPTSNPLDIAISGKGWLVVDTPDGMNYTRNGHLQIDSRNTLTTPAGHPVLGENDRPIVLTATGGPLVISPDGTVTADGQVAGRIKLVSFENEQELRKKSESLYTTEAPPLPAPDARIGQGLIEESNVKPIVEITNMIAALRSFQSAQQVIEEEHKRQMEAVDGLTQVTS